MENISESILVIIYMLHSRSLRSTAKNKEKLKKRKFQIRLTYLAVKSFTVVAEGEIWIKFMLN